MSPHRTSHPQNPTSPDQTQIGAIFSGPQRALLNQGPRYLIPPPAYLAAMIQVSFLLFLRPAFSEPIRLFPKSGSVLLFSPYTRSCYWGSRSSTHMDIRRVIHVGGHICQDRHCRRGTHSAADLFAYHYRRKPHGTFWSLVRPQMKRTRFYSPKAVILATSFVAGIQYPFS